LVVICSAKISNSWIDNLKIKSGSVSESTIYKIEVAGSATIINNQFPSSTAFDFLIDDYGSPLISNNTINCQVRVIRGRPTFSYNTIDGGIHADSASGASEILNNVIRVRGNSYAVYVRGVSATITGNTITGDGAQSGGVNVGGIYEYVVSDNTITNCRVAVSATTSNKVKIERNTITNNQDGIYVNLYRSSQTTSTSYTSTIINNVITDNTETGLYLEHSSSSTVRNNIIANNKIGIEAIDAGEVKRNDIYNNSQFNLKVGSGDIDVSYNYWGTTDTTAIDQTIYDQKYDFTAGTVNYMPILTVQYNEIPEFPTWTILPILITTTLTSILAKKQLNKNKK
jgi:parallel beta-helix repeat protein